MIHALLAGTLCTIALVIAAIEHFQGSQRPSVACFAIYGLGTLGWTLAGLTVNSVSLVMISTIQAAAAFLCAWLSFITKGPVND
jgi:hypothetical protein